MHSLSDRGVPLGEHQDVRPHGPHLDWETVRIFLEVVRCGSFRSASEHLGLSVNALRRRIEELEQRLNATLVTRHVDGIRVTPEGETVLGTAARMELVSFELIRACNRAIPAVAGEIKLAATEGLGTLWVAPRLVELQRKYPRLLVDLSCAMKSADVLRLQADAAIQLIKPSAPDLKVVKLGRLHAMPFAGRTYVETYGVPRTKDEFIKHRLVLQIADQTRTAEIFQRLFPGVAHQGVVALRTNTSSAHIGAISQGVGIGWVPTYVQAINGQMIPIDIADEFRLPFDIWLTYHADAGRIPRVRKMIEWIVDAFDPRKYPWFRDEFIHPNELTRQHALQSDILKSGLAADTQSAARTGWDDLALRSGAA